MLKSDHSVLSNQVNSALHPPGVAKSSTSFGWGKGGKVTTAGWQVTLCDPIWHVISHSGEVISITNCYIRFTFTFFTKSRPKLFFLIMAVTKTPNYNQFWCHKQNQNRIYTIQRHQTAQRTHLSITEAVELFLCHF